nr:MAG TPA: motif TRP-interacting helix [Caudoviricetes sp.]
MMHILKLLKCLAYVFATAVVAMVLALFYWMIPVAMLDLASQKPALVVFYQVTGIVAAATVLPTLGFFALKSYVDDIAKGEM